jgi:hypothetical protein
VPEQLEACRAPAHPHRASGIKPDLIKLRSIDALQVDSLNSVHRSAAREGDAQVKTLVGECGKCFLRRQGAFTRLEKYPSRFRSDFQ